MNWQEVIKQEIDTAWKDGWLKGMEQGKAEALSEPTCVYYDADLDKLVDAVYKSKLTVESVPLSVIEDIKAEIKSESFDFGDMYGRKYIPINVVFDIINKAVKEVAKNDN